MPAQKIRREPDAQADLLALITANEEAYGSAERALALRQAGKDKAAQAAERKAKGWLRKAMDIQARYPKATREATMLLVKQ